MKNQEQFEKGYISGCTTSLELCSSSSYRKGVFTDTVKVPGIFYDGCTSRISRGNIK